MSITSFNCRNSSNLVEAIQTAKELRDALWGKEFKDILENVFVKETTWQYVPEKWIKSLQMSNLGHCEAGLLIRPEYDAAYQMDVFNREKSMEKTHQGIVVTGHPGIGALFF